MATTPSEDRVEKPAEPPKDPTKDRSRLTLRGIASNWTALAYAFVAAFFLTPFIIHHLGNVTYGVWTLIVSITSYMTLLDLGLRGAVTRFVSRSDAQGNRSETNEVTSAALWLYLRLGAAAIILSLVVSVWINRLFHIPPEMQSATRAAILLAGASLALTLMFSVFSGVLAASHRFDLISGVSIAQTTLRVAGVVFVLKSGYGILGLAVCELLVAIFRDVLLVVLCFRTHPHLRVSLRAPARKTLKAFWSYSSYVFIGQVFGQVVAYTDNIVVGSMISISAVTFFSIGGSLVDYLRQIFITMTGTFLPLAGSFQAKGEHHQLRRLLIEGSRFSLLFSLPIAVSLFFRGETFIRLWMGAQYAPISSRVLQILLVGQLFSIANSTAVNITYGMAKHHRPTLWNIVEAVANLSLSIILARKIGIYGVAIGTLIPRLAVCILLWPSYICEVVETRLRTYLWQSWGRPASAALPYAVASYFADRYLHPENLVSFFLQIAALLPLYALTVALCFRQEIAGDWLSRLKMFSRPAT